MTAGRGNNQTRHLVGIYKYCVLVNWYVVFVVVVYDIILMVCSDISEGYCGGGGARCSQVLSLHKSLKALQFPVCQPSASPKLTTQSTVGLASHRPSIMAGL